MKIRKTEWQEQKERQSERAYANLNPESTWKNGGKDPDHNPDSQSHLEKLQNSTEPLFSINLKQIKQQPHHTRVGQRLNEGLAVLLVLRKGNSKWWTHGSALDEPPTLERPGDGRRERDGDGDPHGEQRPVV
jgi:hypothetical protein